MAPAPAAHSGSSATSGSEPTAATAIAAEAALTAPTTGPCSCDQFTLDCFLEVFFGFGAASAAAVVVLIGSSQVIGASRRKQGGGARPGPAPYSTGGQSSCWVTSHF